MSSAPSARSSAPRLSPDDWDKLREEFLHSLLIDTSIAALAENIDGCRWPLRGEDETPAAYVHLDHAEALARLRSLGQSPAALDKLADILRGTLAFDASFGEMVHIAGQAEADNDPVARNLERLAIPADFPVALCNFKATTLDFCQREKIATLGEFIAFARSVARQVILGSEFRDLLNSLSHLDEPQLARLLPYRLKTSGLYLVEGLAHLVRALPAARRAQLVASPEKTAADLLSAAEKLAAHFAGQLAEMRATHAAGTPLARLVAPLDDIGLEPAVAALLGRLLVPAAPPADKSVGERPGFLRRLFARRS